MTVLTLTNAAKADLKDIGRYTEKRWGREQRNVYLRMLEDTLQSIAENPSEGKDCDDIRAGYRKWYAGSHVIFYRNQGLNSIEVVRVLHGRMDIEARLAGK